MPPTITRYVVSMMKMIGILITEEEHKRLKQWCLDNDTTISGVVREGLVFTHCLDVTMIEKVTQTTDENYTTKTVDIRGTQYNLPTPCQITAREIIVPDDTPEGDTELLGGLGKVVILNAGWKTVTLLSLKV